MTNQTAPHAKKPYVPKRTIGSMQTSFILGIMRAKGYVAQDYILSIIAELSTAKNFSDISFEEAQYFVKRLPNVRRDQIDAFMRGEATKNEIGLAPFVPAKSNGKRFNKGGKA